MCLQKEGWISPLVKQIWTTAGVLLSNLALGMAQGFMSVLLIALRKPESSIKIDAHLANWLASGMAMSVIVGTLTSTIIMELYGRKIAFILEVLPGITAILLVYFSSDFTTLMAARILDGVTAGGTVTLGAVIIGEYTSPSYRGIFLNLKTAYICLGTTIVHSLGYYFHWKMVALTALVPYTVALVIIFTWPESPVWLASRNRFEDCKKSFIWLRGPSDEANKELVELIKAQEERTASSFKPSFLIDTGSFFKKFWQRDFLKPVFIMICISLLLETCGKHIFPVYAADIVDGIVGNHGSSFFYTLIIDLIVTISCTCSTIFIKLMKMRTLLFSSGIASLVVLANACLYLFLTSQEIISRDKPWIPMTMFIVYFIVVNLGCTSIPLSLIGEIIPLEHKSCGVFVFCIISSITVMVALNAFPYLLLVINIYGTFAVLGLIMAVVLFALYWTLPETKSRTLQEIEDCIKFGKVQNRGENNEKSSEQNARFLDSMDF